MSKIVLQGNNGGTGTFTVQPPATNVNRNIILPDIDGTLAIADENINLGVSVPASGTAVDFVGIPASVKRITVMFDGVSTNGTSFKLTQIGVGAFENTGYECTSTSLSSTPSNASGTEGFYLRSNGAADSISGVMSLDKIVGNIWVCSFVVRASTEYSVVGGGSKSLSGPLDRLRITTVNGTDTFDAGTINISWEY